VAAANGRAAVFAAGGGEVLNENPLAAATGAVVEGPPKLKGAAATAAGGEVAEAIKLNPAAAGTSPEDFKFIELKIVSPPLGAVPLGPETEFPRDRSWVGAEDGPKGPGLLTPPLVPVMDGGKF